MTMIAPNTHINTGVPPDRTGENMGRSLTFGTCARAFVRSGRNKTKWETIVQILRSDLNHARVDTSFGPAYEKYMQGLSHLKPNTRNNHRILIRAIIRHAYELFMIDQIPVRNWHMERRGERHRIIDEKEWLAVLNKAKEVGSHLYWPYYLLYTGNPIRKMDFVNLTLETLQINRRNPWIRFYAGKTLNTIGLPTYLGLLDDQMLGYFRWRLSVYPECPYVFFRMIDKQPQYMGNPIKHHRWICQEAKVKDLRIHDMKHWAVSRMWMQGYHSDHLRKLNIQWDQRMVDLYNECGADDVFDVVQPSKTGVKCA